MQFTEKESALSSSHQSSQLPPTTFLQFHFYNPQAPHLSPVHTLHQNYPLNSHPNDSQDFLHRLQDIRKSLHGCSKFMQVEVNQKQSLHELLYEDDLIGIIGKPRKREVEVLQMSQMITINENCEINCLTAMRPYAFSNIFIGHNIQEFSAQDLVKCWQTLTFSLGSVEEIQTLIEELEDELLKNFNFIKLRKIEEKLKLQVNLIKNVLWITINKKLTHQQFLIHYFHHLFNLDIKTLNQDFISKLQLYLNIEDISELVALKKQIPDEFGLHHIESKLNEKIKKAVQKTHNESERDEKASEKNISEESSLCGNMNFPFNLEYESENKRIRARSRSSQFENKNFFDEIKIREEKLLQQLQQYL